MRLKRLAIAGTSSQAELAKAPVDVRSTARPGVSESARERIAVILSEIFCQFRAIEQPLLTGTSRQPGLGPPVGRDGARRPGSETAPPVLAGPRRATVTVSISDRNLNDTLTTLYQTALLR
jgi:hypothetical protein